jgi:hypothetical protein
MVGRLRGKLTFANLVSFLALFVALSGFAVAATQLKKNSVGTKQLKMNAVTTAKIKNEAVTTEKIKNEAVTDGKLANGSVGAAQLQANSITGTNVRDGSLGAADLAPGTIPTQTPRTARLQSGETITGFMAIEEHATNGTEFFGTGAGFQLLPQNPIPKSNRIMVTGSSEPHCPGVGQAAPGYLCAYKTSGENAKEPRLYPETGSQTDPTTYGIQLQVLSETEGTVLFNAVWAYTEP